MCERFQACPDFKGIKTNPLDRFCMLNCFKLALISKGLRHSLAAWRVPSKSFQACPDFKGIKTTALAVLLGLDLFQACPDFKGIKTSWHSNPAQAGRFQACPDFKGIKTSSAGASAGRSAFQACPDFKGIKTRAHLHEPILCGGFKLALISKGLRRPHTRCCPLR